ncbi:MAG: glycosyltransferase family 4 protein [Desulfovibrio sp.]|nr:glycosyltransferase family 4 protein [Desulfovibrio sp.]
MKVIVLGNQARAMSNFWTVLMKKLLSLGHEVICCVPDGDKEANVRLLSVCTKVKHYFLKRKGLNPLEDLRTYWELLTLFKRERPDLVFATTIKPVIYGCSAARYARVPHCYATITGLGYTFEQNSFFKKLIHGLTSRMYRFALKGVDGVFFQNEADAQVFQTAGILQPDAKVLQARGTGVDVDYFQVAEFPDLASNSMVFLFVGRLLEAKGLQEFATAARIVKSKYPQAEFQILGPEERGLGGVSKEQVLDWEKQGIVEYLGSTDDVRPYLSACHVLVLPSWREGLSTVTMEAMSMGRPVIVTDVPGCKELVWDQQNGLRVPVRDPQSLAKACVHFLEHPDQLAVMGETGRTFAEKFFAADVVARDILSAMHVEQAEGGRQ